MRRLCQDGVFRGRRSPAIKAGAWAKAFRVTVNCTLFNGEDPGRMWPHFFDTRDGNSGVEGITVSPRI